MRLGTNVLPVENRIGRIPQGDQTERQILEVVEIVLDRLSDHVGATAGQGGGSAVKFVDEFIWDAGGDLSDGDTPDCR